MSRIRLVALDLDNTLFDDRKNVSEVNRLAIQKVKELEVKVVITTGRPLMAIGNLLAELGLDTSEDYSLTFNGGLIQRNDGHVLAQTTLSRKQVVELCELLGVKGLPVDILSDGCVYSLPAKDRVSRYPEANPLLTFKRLASLSELPTDIIYNKIVIVADRDFLDQKIAELPATLFEHFEAFKSREIIFEIMPKGVHKAAGLAHLCEILELPRESVMAIGDEENDLSMIEWAGLGIAMQNAIPAVKELANGITSRDNNHSGVAEAIEKYVLSED